VKYHYAEKSMEPTIFLQVSGVFNVTKENLHEKIVAQSQDETNLEKTFVRN